MNYHGEELPPGAACVAFIGLWLHEHWAALVIGCAVGICAVAVPAKLIAGGGF